MPRGKKRNVPFKEQFKDVSPITNNQKLAFEEFNKGQNLVLHGYAGTGKTYISMFFGLRELFNNDEVKHIVVIRNAVPTQDLGHLPGTYEEKIAPYEEPYDSICDALFKTKNNYDELKDRAYLTFMPVSFIRGISFDDCIVIVDECQNMNFHQLDSVITRVGHRCRIIFSGDFTQSDLRKQSEKEDVKRFINILDDMDSFSHIEFGEQDIVRSELVKEYIIKKHKKGIE